MAGIDATHGRRAVLLALAGALASAPLHAQSQPQPQAQQEPQPQPQQEPQPQAPRVRLLGVDRIALGGDTATLDLRLQLDNPHPYPVPLHALRLRCAFDGIDLARGKSLQPVRLPARGSAVLALRLDVDARALLAVLATLPADGVVDYTLDGDAEIGLTMLRVPLHAAGRIALPQR
jgi:LEA14-like dessication related protein